MFKKAIRYDENTIFYFDQNDRKYVADKGSVAWRTNNPGLIFSRHSLAKAHKSIGSHHQVAIFPSIKHGMAALRGWLKHLKYQKPLFEVAKHYRPDNPVECMETLCFLTGFSQDVNFNELMAEELEKIVKAIQSVTGFFIDPKASPVLLPRITARYYSKTGRKEFYISGYEEIISKEEAISRIGTHKLDGVIVHQGNGTVYLRSRPGYQLDRIVYSETEIKGAPFKDAIRDLGDQKTGQCIWAYINGLDNTPQEAQKTTQLISSFANGEKVWSLANDKRFILSLGNIWDACLQKLNLETEVTKFAVVFLRLLLKISDEDPLLPPVIIFAHSQGAIIAKAALKLLEAHEASRLRIFTFGAGSFVFPSDAHPDTHNYISHRDPVPRLAVEGNFADLAIRRHIESSQGLSNEQIIEALINEDIESNLITNHPQAILLYRMQRKRYYLSEFEKIKSITVLSDGVEVGWEHSVWSRCYQNQIRKIIEMYRVQIHVHR